MTGQGSAMPADALFPHETEFPESGKVSKMEKKMFGKKPAPVASASPGAS